MAAPCDYAPITQVGAKLIAYKDSTNQPVVDQNVKDLTEIADEIKSRLDIRPVRWIEHVLDAALERQPTALPDAAGDAVPAVPPPPAPVTTPDEETVATAVLLELNATARPVRVLPFASRTVAVAVVVFVTLIGLLASVTTTDATAA